MILIVFLHFTKFMLGFIHWVSVTTLVTQFWHWSWLFISRVKAASLFHSEISLLDQLVRGHLPFDGTVASMVSVIRLIRSWSSFSSSRLYVKTIRQKSVSVELLRCTNTLVSKPLHLLALPNRTIRVGSPVLYVIV